MYLFLDQSSTKSGWSVFKKPFVLHEYGLINLSAMPTGTDDAQTNKRYSFIEQMRELVYKHSCKMISTEGVYGGKENLKTYKILSQLQASIFDWCKRNEIVAFAWSAAGEWRSCLNLNPKAKRDELKELTKQYVLSRYDIPDNLEDDIYDSIAMADAYFIKIGEMRG